MQMVTWYNGFDDGDQNRIWTVCFYGGKNTEEPVKYSLKQGREPLSSKEKNSAQI